MQPVNIKELINHSQHLLFQFSKGRSEKSTLPSSEYCEYLILDLHRRVCFSLLLYMVFLWTVRHISSERQWHTSSQHNMLHSLKLTMRERERGLGQHSGRKVLIRGQSLAVNRVTIHRHWAHGGVLERTFSLVSEKLGVRWVGGDFVLQTHSWVITMVKGVSHVTLRPACIYGKVATQGARGGGGAGACPGERGNIWD